MARRLASNVPGPFFVDDSCIDCGACRWIAPESFDAEGDHSRVHRQPEAEPERRQALKALVACPTGSIGSAEPTAGAAALFPDRLAEGVYHCGFHSEDSFGAASYLVVRERGNVLVDSPRAHRGLFRRIDELGGVAWMFLTHRDDVAEHERIAARFGCRRVLHAADVSAATRAVELQPEGDEPIQLDDDLTLIPTPGHTRGSACLLHRGTLFSGDHLAFSRARGQLVAFHDACWFDWGRQIRSMERLLDFAFERVLPGHGAPRFLPAAAMRVELERCVAWMRGVR